MSNIAHLWTEGNNHPPAWKEMSEVFRGNFGALCDQEISMRISARGRVTIPEDIRRQAGLHPHSEVEIEFDGETIRIVPRNTLGHLAAPLLSPEEVRFLLGRG